MQHLAPPQYSPDGRWWWNGRAWVRVTWPVQGWAGAPDPYAGEEEEEPRRRTPAVLWVGVIALAALLLLAFGASFLTWARLQVPGIGGLARPTAPATAAPAAPDTPAPTATPQSGSSGTDAYQQVVTSDAARFQAAGQAVADRCSADALARGTGRCRGALQSLDDSVQRFQSDLAATPAPACLQPADAQLRAALAEYHQGIQQELNGIDHQDLVAVTAGAATLGDAGSHAQSAAGLLQNSSC